MSDRSECSRLNRKKIVGPGSERTLLSKAGERGLEKVRTEDRLWSAY